MSLAMIIGKVLVLATVYTAKIAQSVNGETDIYGTWHIDKVALISETYSVEKVLYRSEDYVGLELEYAEDFCRIDDQVFENPKYEIRSTTVYDVQRTGMFWMPTLYQYIHNEGIILKNEKNGCTPHCELQRVEVSIGEKYVDKKGIWYFLIPEGGDCILLNDDTMLLNDWGKVLVATRIDGGKAEKWDELKKMVLEMDKGNGVEY